METARTHTGEIAPLAADAARATRPLAPADARAALAEGWRDFLAKPSHNMFLALIYPLAGLVLIRAASGGAALPLVWPLISGFALVGPVAAIGLIEFSRRRDLGETPRWEHALAPFGRPGGGAALRIALVLFALFVLWLAAARGVHAVTLGPSGSGSLAAFAGRLVGTAEGWTLILLGNALGFLFAVAVLLIGAFSLPLALDGERSARRAMALSARMVAANPRAMALWGGVIGAGLAASITLGLVSLAVAPPIFAHATWRFSRAAFAAATLR